MESTSSAVAFTAPDRGVCAECGRSLKLRLFDGYVPVHGDCPGGGRPPAKVKTMETVELPL